MSLSHEATVKIQGYRIGDMKIAAYSIAFTANTLIEPELGFFLMNGAPIVQVTYPLLFARFGSALPDFTDGKVAVPKGLSNFTSYAAVGGEINHTLTSGELPAHGHTDNFAVTADPHAHTGSSSIGGASSGHAHGGMNWGEVLSLGGAGGGVFDNDPTSVSNSTTSPQTHLHSYTGTINQGDSGNANLSGAVSAVGSGGSHNNMGPYLVMGGWLVRHD